MLPVPQGMETCCSFVVRSAELPKMARKVDNGTIDFTCRRCWRCGSIRDDSTESATARDEPCSLHLTVRASNGARCNPKIVRKLRNGRQSSSWFEDPAQNHPFQLDSDLLKRRDRRSGVDVDDHAGTRSKGRSISLGIRPDRRHFRYAHKPVTTLATCSCPTENNQAVASNVRPTETAESDSSDARRT